MAATPLAVAALLGVAPPLAGALRGATDDARPTAAARLDHVSLLVADAAASVAFYRALFDLREVTPPVRGPRWLALDGGAALHLFPGRTAPVPTDRRVHVAIAVDDFPALLARLERARIAFTDFEGRPASVQRVRSDGVRQLFVRDPDGYLIEINDAAGRP